MGCSVGLLVGDLAAVLDHNRRRRPPAVGTDLLHGLNHVVPVHHLPEDDVLPVQPGGLLHADEELGPVRVGASVGHGEDAGPGVLLLEVLVLELEAVYGLPAGAVPPREVPTLAHEVGDYPVEGRALVVQGLAGAPDPLLAGAEAAEVLGGLRDDVREKLHDDPPRLGLADKDVEEDLRICHLLLSLPLPPEAVQVKFKTTVRRPTPPADQPETEGIE